MQTTFREPRYKDGKIVALVDVSFDEGIIVKGFRIVQSEKGLFAAVPSKPVVVEGQTRYVNQVGFATSELRKRVLAEILEAFALWEQGPQASATSASG